MARVSQAWNLRSVNRFTIKVPPIHRCTPNPRRVTQGVSAFFHLLSTAFCAYVPRPFRSLAPSAPRRYGGPYSAFMAPTYREDRQHASQHHRSTWREVSKSGPEQDRPFSFRRDRNKPCKLFRLCSRPRILAGPLATRQIHVCDQAVGRACHDRLALNDRVCYSHCPVGVAGTLKLWMPRGVVAAFRRRLQMVSFRGVGNHVA